MRHSSLRHCLLAATLAVPASAHANTGIGMGPFLPISVALVPALLVVIPLEAGILRLALPVRFGRALWLSFLANLLSTLLGAVFGAALDVALMSALRLATGLATFIAGVLSMYALTAWIEYRVIGRRLAEPHQRVRGGHVTGAVFGPQHQHAVDPRR